MWQSKSLFVSLWLVIVALNLIGLFVLLPAVGGHFKRAYTLNHYDGDGYDQIAENLASGNGYRLYPHMAKTLMREPGYPILLAGLYKTFGRSLRLVQSLNLILALATAYLIMRFAGELSNSRLLIFGSPLLFLFHPETLLAESRGGVEILFGFMLALYILTIHRAIKSARWRDYLVSGAVLGLTCLVRSTPILFPVFLLGYFLVFERRRRATITIFRNFAVMVAAMFLVLSPWITRNYLLTKQFVPTASVLGVSAQAGLYLSTQNAVGNRDIDTAAFWERNKLARELGYPFKAGYYQYFYSSADEVAFSHYLFTRVLHTYEGSPMLFVRTVLYNGLFNFWCAGKTRRSEEMDAIVQFPLLGLAMLGLILGVRDGRARDLGPMALLIVYIVAVSTPILAQARYSAPLIPFLSILACDAVVIGLSSRRGAQHNLGELAPVAHYPDSQGGHESSASAALMTSSSRDWSRQEAANVAVFHPDRDQDR